LVLQQLPIFSRRAHSGMARLGQAASQCASLAGWAAASLHEVACDLVRSPRAARGSWNRTPFGPLIERTLAEQAMEAKQAKARSPWVRATKQLARDPPAPVQLGR
jgi:hypothetical protein